MQALDGVLVALLAAQECAQRQGWLLTRMMDRAVNHILGASQPQISTYWPALTQTSGECPVRHALWATATASESGIALISACTNDSKDTAAQQKGLA